MKKLIFLLLVVAFLFSCNKKEERSGLCDTYLNITSTNTPKTTTASAGITTVVRGYGSNLCYSFTGTEITPGASNSIEIKLKGKFPCGPAICAEALLSVRDTVTINTTQTGSYYLKFFNGNSLFKTDTVIVN
jgi:hypothetical protein